MHGECCLSDNEDVEGRVVVRGSRVRIGDANHNVVCQISVGNFNTEHNSRAQTFQLCRTLRLRLVGWLTGWLTGWLADWLAGWLAGWLADDSSITRTEAMLGYTLDLATYTPKEGRAQ